jgi:hypothetical protein
MKEFMYLFRGGDAVRVQQSPEEMQKHMEKWGAWMKSLAEKGRFKAGQPLDQEGKLVSGKNKMITDGPFPEAREVVGGFLIVNAGSLEEAAQMAKDCPIFEHEGTVEVRAIQEMTM